MCSLDYTLTYSSARQPLVQAPGPIKETALFRKLTAAGAHATLSPARRGKSSVPARHMDALGETEEEDGDEKDVKPIIDQGGYDAGVRQREIANQKARIVSQMTANQRAPPPRPSPVKKLSSGLSPAKTVAYSAGRKQEPIRMADAKERASLFDTCAHNLELALSQGPDFRSRA